MESGTHKTCLGDTSWVRCYSCKACHWFLSFYLNHMHTNFLLLFFPYPFHAFTHLPLIMPFQFISIPFRKDPLSVHLLHKNYHVVVIIYSCGSFCYVPQLLYPGEQHRYGLPTRRTYRLTESMSYPLTTKPSIPPPSVHTSIC